MSTIRKTDGPSTMACHKRGHRHNVFVDVSTTIESKVDAMQLYNGGAHPFPHPRSAEALRAIACRWGSVVSEYAEAFELVRSRR